MSTALDAILPLPAAPLEWPLPVSHLSATQLTMFQRCAEQYRRRYILREKERPGAALVWGRADHYAHEQNFTQKIVSGVDIPEDEVKVAFAEGFDQAVQDHGGESEVAWDEKPAVLKDKGVELVGAYHRIVSPTVQPVAVEDRFEVAIPGVPVPVVGMMDVREQARAIERKTAKSAPPNRAAKPEWRIQGLLYQAVADLPVEWHVSVKTKTPTVIVPSEDALGLRLPFNERTVAATQVLVRNTAQAIVAYWNTYGPDSPWPGAITHPWACSFCGYRPSCAWWAQ